jgi:hypothetical protein
MNLLGYKKFLLIFIFFTLIIFFVIIFLRSFCLKYTDDYIILYKIPHFTSKVHDFLDFKYFFIKL